jgi:hypothetical protein
MTEVTLRNTTPTRLKRNAAQGNASPSHSVPAMSCTSANPAHKLSRSFFVEGTMNAEGLSASEEEAKRQTLLRL